MAATEIDLGASLRTKRSRTGQRNKFYLEFTSTDLKLDLDEQRLGEPVAWTLAVVLREALLAGRKLDGSPMPSPSPATIKRREYRDKQQILIAQAKTRRHRKHVREAMRAADPQARMKTHRSGATTWLRYSETQAQIDEATRAGSKMAFVAGMAGGDTEIAFRSGYKHALDKARTAARNYKRRFHALKLGAYDPKTHSNTHPIGVESGMLADSIVAESRPPGWAVYVTDRRSFIDRTGDSPARRVFERTGMIQPGAMANPRLRAALEATASAVFVHRAKKVLAELQQTYRRVEAIKAEAERAVEE